MHDYPIDVPLQGFVKNSKQIFPFPSLFPFASSKLVGCLP